MTLPLQVAFLTGQSDPGRCARSPQQRAFLDAVPVPEAARVPTNFPYDPQTPPYRDVPLATASWHNTRQYLRSRSARFADERRPSVVRMLARAEHTVILAGSCGLELLANLQLPSAALVRVHVFAYGPVARKRPACDVVVVCGRGDWLARRRRVQVDHEVSCGHMSYLQHPDVLALCRAFVTRVAAQGGAVRT